MSNCDQYRLTSYEKDQLIAQLKLEIYDLRKHEKDIVGIQNEVNQMEHRCRLLQDDKYRASGEQRMLLDQANHDFCETRKQLDDLKFLLCEK